MALKSTKSNRCLQIACVSESNLCTVTFTLSPACSDSFLLCLYGFSHAKGRESSSWEDKGHTHWTVWELVGRL